MNLAAQYIAVGLAVIIAVGWVVRRIVRRRKSPSAGCGCGCSGCDLADNCASKPSRQSTRKK